MSHSVIMIGATGAVGGHVVQALIDMPSVARITLLGRRAWDGPASAKITAHIVDVLDPTSYTAHLAGHTVGISTLGVGQPSKMSKADFVRIDKDAVLDFATACKHAGVQHFSMLSSVGVGAESRSFFLRTKGELEAGVSALGFARVSLIHPSMILTPTNRYGVSQAVTLKLWPLLKPVLCGRARKLRGIPVARLGAGIAHDLDASQTGVQVLEWDDLMTLSDESKSAG